MAYKPSPNSLIHCNQCGEDYSVTYRRCPFCGARNLPQQPDPDRPDSSSDMEDTYVFDGQDMFDGEEEEYSPARSRGGKRLAERPLSNPFANADINWPRVITFICSLIIIVAAMIIVFTVIYPQLRGNPAVDNSESPSPSDTGPGSSASQSPDPSPSVSGPTASDPVTTPPVSPSPSVPAGLLTVSFRRANDADFTLSVGESHTITLDFVPANWSGEVVWSSSNTQYATVDPNGKVTNVNTTAQLRHVTITVTAGGLTLKSEVYCKGVTATEPTNSVTPSNNPNTSPSPSGSGTVTVGKKGVVKVGPGGVFVRSDPSKSGNNMIASLFNGDPITVIADAGNGWYKISFAGSKGATEGYILGEYISTD